ncbi:transposase [Candidatus Saganbacteria bacterium]|nr:transposase [Candidatus Saganbacteria bacterium]
MTLFQNKYRKESTRLPNWDYSDPGAYFVTICSKDRLCCLSDIKDGKIKLSKIGNIVQEEWHKTEKIRSNIKLDIYAIMPNHFHGIIIITENQNITVETTRRVVSTTLKPNSLGSIIGQFKSICTKRIWAEGFADFAWQSRFYESIIRNEIQFEKIRKYIENNPYNWEFDKNNPRKTK